MQQVNLTGLQYFGADITNVTVEKNAGKMKDGMNS